MTKPVLARPAAAPGAPAATSARPAPARRRAFEPLALAERFGLPLLFLVTLVAFSLLRPETFAQTANFQNIATSQSVLMVVGLALMFPLVGGRFDVSVGGILSVSAMTVSALMANHGWALVPAGCAAVAVGAALGLVNGVIVAYLGVNSIIATIGTGTVMGGLVQAYTKGSPITSGLSSALTDLSARSLLGIPLLFVIAVGVSAAVAWILTQTAFGRRLVATGSNLSAARLVGLDVHRMVLMSFVASGLLAGVAGVLQISAQGSFDPGAGGLAFILPALAAVFLGATTWRPGTYNVPGTVISLLFIGSTITGLVLVGVEPWVTDVFYGASVVLAIVVSAQIRRRRTGTLEVGT